MTQDAGNEMPQEDYMHDYDGALTKQVIMGRTADTHAAFLLPHVRSCMSLLDCGCGPGTITSGLAEAASPGEVIGIDLEESQLQLARENATKRGLSNLSFESCSVYELPYQDARFDVVFSNAMLEHMQDPMAVLKEMYRVLKPGGLIGIRTIDLEATLIAPQDAVLTRANEIWLKYRQYCGGDPFIGRRLRATPSGSFAGSGFCQYERICDKRNLGDAAVGPVIHAGSESRVHRTENHGSGHSRGMGGSGPNGASGPRHRELGRA